MRGRFHWKGFETEFRKQLQLENVQCVELLGNGYLNNEATPARIEDAIQDFKKQVDIESSQPMGILGISLGGMLATKWAQLEPETFSHLTVINSSSSLSPFYHRLIPKNYPGILKVLFKNNADYNEKFIFDVTSNFPEKWRPYLDENIAFSKKHPLQAKNFMAQLLLASQINFKDNLKCKTMVLASRKDRLVSVACSEAIAKAWQCPIHYHESAGHDLTLDDTQWIIDQVKKF
ncbi:MAG: alpha/beta fold hydrolase [Pseudobdellovibrio sp.]